RDPDHDRVERLRQRRPPELDRAQERLGVGGRRGAAEDGGRGQLARDTVDQAPAGGRRERPERAPQPRSREPLEDVLLVRVPAEDAGEVERERDAEERDARRQLPLELDGELPAVRARRLEQRRRPGGPHRLGRGAAKEGGGASRHDRLGGGHRDHEVGLDQRRRDPQRDGAGGAEGDEVLRLRVVHDHPAAEAAAELGAEEQADLPRGEALLEAGRDEHGEPLDAERLELVDGRGDRLLAGVPDGGRDREVGRLDHQRRRPAAGREPLERRPGEREAEGLPDGRADVRDRAPRRRGSQDEAAVADVDDGDPGTGEERDPGHVELRAPGRRGGGRGRGEDPARGRTPDRARGRAGNAEGGRAGHGRREPYTRAVAPKTLTGAELQLDDAPAREAELFLVDGNNLAYRAFFALPEELATSDGRPTNALLGFTNMLFKLLSDYRPRGVAVAWDSRPVHRAAVAEAAEVVYKEGRRPMPDLLGEQFPHFRPIVEAFGYRNLEFEGWEADDVIATLATRADAAGIRTCVVSTDRDAFQLCSENVCLMMTTRGVADVHVYTPERVEARYGVRPDQVADFIGLKGDTSDNIPGVPGIGDKTAGQLVAQYGSLEAVIEHASELSPARARNITEHADQARISKELATMRRDLDIDCDPGQLVLAPPDPSQLKELFRRFEFRGLLRRLDALDEAVPSASLVVEGVSVSWREGDPGRLEGPIGLTVADGRIAVAKGGEVVLTTAPLDNFRGAEIVTHDAKALGVEAVDDTLIAAYLIEPGRASYELDDLGPEYGIELVPSPSAEEETEALVRAAELPRRLAPMLLARLDERDLTRLYREVELPLTAVLADMEAAGVKIDTYRMGEITARLAERVAELEALAFELAGEEFMLGSTQQVARVLFEKLELTAGRKGKTGYSTDARVLRAIRDEHAIVPVIEEWRELSKLLNTYLGPLPALIDETTGRLHTTINQTVASTGRLSTTSPNLQSIPIRTELGREIRSAFVAEEGAKLLSADYSQIELRILAHVSGEPKLRDAFERGEDIHAATASEMLGV